jgi:hypothetical protein
MAALVALLFRFEPSFALEPSFPPFDRLRKGQAVLGRESKFFLQCWFIAKLDSRAVTKPRENDGRRAEKRGLQNAVIRHFNN